MSDIAPTTGFVSREQLPQIKHEDHPDFLQFLWGKGVQHTTTELPASKLKPSQHSIDLDKVSAMLQDPSDALTKPLLVSQDWYILDGHHSHAALKAMADDILVPVHILHVPIDELITHAHEFPGSNTRSITEEKERARHSVLSFGRFNPPTAGHAKLVHKGQQVAQAHHADHHVVLSHSQDAERNPLSPADKLKHAKHAFPGAHLSLASKEHPTIFHHASELSKSGTQHLHVVVGSDRVKEFHDSLHKYNGVKTKEGHGYKFKSITVHSAGHRDPDAKGVEGISASKMREHATKGNFHEFKKGVAPTVSKEHAKELYHDVRKGMGHMNESSEDMEYLRDPSFKKLRGKFPVATTKKPTPHCKDCEGTGYVHKSGYGAAPSHVSSRSSLCHCTHLKEEVEYLSEGVHDQSIFKAVFLAGGPGSGKDFIMKKTLDGHGMVEINSDSALEYLMDKKKLDKKMPESEKDQRDAVRAKAKSMTDLRHRLAFHGRNGMIINSTGDDKTKIKLLKKHLEDEGYDTKMVFVHASDKVSADRNITRGQRGGRMVPEKVRATKWQKSQDQRVDYAKIFGTDHYHEFDNSADHKTAPPEVVQQKEQELSDLHKTVKKFTQTPPAHPNAQQWIAKSLGNLINQPKMAEKLIKDAPPKFPGPKMKPAKGEPNPNSEAADEARRKGLEYYGYGKYGKGGTVTHFSLHGKLQQRDAPPTLEEKKRAAEKAKASTTPASKPRPKAVNEAFEAFLNETPNDPHSPLGAMEKAKELGHVGVQVHLNTLYTKRDNLPKEKHTEWNKEIRKFEAAKLHLAPPAPPAPAPAKKSLTEMLNTLRGGLRYMEDLEEANAPAGSADMYDSPLSHGAKERHEDDGSVSSITEKLSPEKQAEVDVETAKIKVSAEDHTQRHQFKAAHWTHPNGHPRCRLCGCEEPVGGYCKS